MIRNFVRRALHPAAARLKEWFVSQAAESPTLARLYYALLNRAYVRDQHAFMAGRAAYARSLSAPFETMALLRRNVHRIEKGLVMRPRRLPFGLDYIAETVRAYKIAGRHAVDRQEIAWATDVLDTYFHLHAGIESLSAHAAEYAGARAFEEATNTKVPNQRTVSNPVSFDALSTLARQRRSVRWFLQDRVPRAALDRAIEVGAQAPSACNRQPFIFHVIDSQPLVERVLSIPYGAAGFSHQVPAVVIIVGQQRHFFRERDRHLVYLDAGLAAMGVLYALETQGLASCCINWADIAEREEEMATVLRLQPDERPIMLIAVGYEDRGGLSPYSQKKSLRVLRRYHPE